MKIQILLGTLALTACATSRPPTQIETRDVVVTRTERAVTEQEVRDIAPPAPLGARPGVLRSALDLALAKLCEYVGYAERADILLQHAAGLTPVQRVNEPICAPAETPSRP